MPDTPDRSLGDRLGYEHGKVYQGQPCPYGDEDLYICEKYVAEETRRLHAATWDEDGAPNTLTVGGDSLSDETVETIQTTIECRYCDGLPIPLDTDEWTLTYE